MVDIQTATMIIDASMLALMVTGMPLGIVTLTVSIGTALAFFGPQDCSWWHPMRLACSNPIRL